MISPLRVEWLGRVPYREALAIQERLVEGKIARSLDTPDTLLLLEHDPVYTIGRTQDRSSLLTPALLPHPVETTNRGGQATYHGPGQLVGYLILDLGRRGRDLHRYLRFLEETLVETLAEYGVRGERREGLTGVWVGPRKIASIGVGVRRWVSMHGFAINVAGGATLEPFRAITPCGLAGVEMTAVSTASGSETGVEEFAASVAARFGMRLDEALPEKDSTQAAQSP